MRVSDVVVAAHSFVRAEGLMFHGRQCGLINVRAWDIPTWGKPGFVKSDWPLAIGNDAVTLADNDLAGRLPNVDAVIDIGGMAQDAFIFFVKSVHGRPRECDPSF
jgi:hypothetical protein